MNIIGFLMEHPAISIISILIIAFAFWIWWTKCKWMDEVIENQKKIIELLEKEHDENK